MASWAGRVGAVERIVVAALGDSISAGSPLWDPDPAVRARIAAPDERSQWEWWAARRDTRLEFRNHGVYGERTDQIAARLDAAAAGASVLVVQGGINDVAQRRSVEQAACELAAMVERGRTLGPEVALTDVLPWPNGDPRAADAIDLLNGLIRELAARLEVPLLPFHDTLADPADPRKMAKGLSDDGDHPSVEGHRLLGERAFRLA
jgi:lysophospholipase L1-like esterase